MKIFKLSRSSMRNLEGVREEIKVLINRLLKESPHDFGIPKDGGLRTAERQNELFNKVPPAVLPLSIVSLEVGLFSLIPIYPLFKKSCSK